MRNESQNFKIGLALGGGGARGACHIGVLRALLEADIRPNRICGVSAGAIVGGLYAAGLDPDDMFEWIKESKLLSFIKIGIPKTGLTKLDYLKERIAAAWPENTFEGLRLPLHVGITNLNTGQLELRANGPLHDVIAASCSIPFVFKPVWIDNQQYVDGGVVSNMPVDPLIHSTDFVIGSNLMPYANLAPTDVTTFVGVVWRCFDLSIMANTVPSAALCDIVLEPTLLNDYHIFSLNRLRELHDVGYEETRGRMAEIKNGIALQRELMAEAG